MLAITLVLNLLVALGKIAVGTAFGALSVRADGFHSLMDGASNLIGLIANRIAALPPDADHPYGHRRFETLGAMGVGVLLIFTAFEIVGGVVERRSSGGTPEVSPLIIAVLLVTLVINAGVAAVEAREGRRLRSALLLADSQNTRADLLVTGSVLVSMALTALGQTWADPLAALLVVVLIGRAAWNILRQTGGVLVDTAPFSPEQLAAIAGSVPAIDGVRVQVERARSRGSADAATLDYDLTIAPETTAEQTDAIRAALVAQVRETLPGVQEVEVHFSPRADASLDAFHRVLNAARAQAAAHGLSVHEVQVVGDTTDLHVEVPAGETLAEAHARVSAFEADLHYALPELGAIVTHIEPQIEAQAEPNADTAPAHLQTLGERALQLLQTDLPEAEWHDLHIIPSIEGMGYALSVHATLPATLAVETAHARAELAETRLRAAFPMLRRVTIHTEPPERDDENSREATPDLNRV